MTGDIRSCGQAARAGRNSASRDVGKRHHASEQAATKANGGGMEDGGECGSGQIPLEVTGPPKWRSLHELLPHFLPDARISCVVAPSCRSERSSCRFGKTSSSRGARAPSVSMTETCRVAARSTRSSANSRHEPHPRPAPSRSATCRANEGASTVPDPGANSAARCVEDRIAPMVAWWRNCCGRFVGILRIGDDLAMHNGVVAIRAR